MKKMVFLFLLCGLFVATNSPPNLFDRVGETTLCKDNSSFEVKKEQTIGVSHSVPCLVELEFYFFDFVAGCKKVVMPHLSDSQANLTPSPNVYFSAIASTKYRRC